MLQVMTSTVKGKVASHYQPCEKSSTKLIKMALLRVNHIKNMMEVTDYRPFKFSGFFLARSKGCQRQPTCIITYIYHSQCG